MEQSKIIKAASILYNSRIKCERIDNLPKNLRPKNKFQAYLIQESLVKKYLKNKNSLIGYKIGCTNKEAQKQINVSEPFYGYIFSNYFSKSNISLNSKKFINPYIEPEFSFKIIKELDYKKAPFNIKEIYKSIGSVMPSIEIVDSRFNKWTNTGINNLIADNGVHSFWLYGDEIKNINKFNFNNHHVELLINNKLVKKGNSKNVLGNPIKSLKWLVNNLAKKRKSIKKNMYVSTGTCTPAILLKKNTLINANFGELGIIEFKYN